MLRSYNWQEKNTKEEFFLVYIASYKSGSLVKSTAWSYIDHQLLCNPQASIPELHILLA